MAINRAASDLTRQQYEANFRGATGQQHNLPCYSAKVIP